jgi:hypothetical protein
MVGPMSEKIIFLGSILFGTVGGIAWSELPSNDRASPRVEVPAPPAPIAAASTAAGDVHYSGCNEVRALGKAPLRKGEPGYREDMDGDLDGIACEPHREDL